MRGEEKCRMSKIQDDRREDFLGEAHIAQRWNCSRSTVRRILEAAAVRVYFLSGKRHGLKRYRLVDVKRVEDETQAPAESREGR